jgi:uroporphyrinogen decarboxylase
VDAIFRPGWREEIEHLAEQKRDYFLVAGYSFGVQDRAWIIRGYESFLMDAAGNPDFFGELIRRVADHQMEIVERLLVLPVDAIMFGDDWGYQNGVLLGGERWRRFIKPHVARVYARIHQAGKIAVTHSCGSVAEIIPDLIEIGLDVLESVQPEAAGMNPYELKRRYGSHLTFWGGLGSQSVIQFGTPDEIKAEVGRLCREMGRGGGYILSTAKGFQPGTPMANAVAFIEASLHQAGVDFPFKGPRRKPYAS